MARTKIAVEAKILITARAEYFFQWLSILLEWSLAVNKESTIGCGAPFSIHAVVDITQSNESLIFFIQFRFQKIFENLRRDNDRTTLLWASS